MRAPPPAGEQQGEPPDRAELARQAIISAATAAFAEAGYAKTAMADVAGRAGTSVGLLYYHFGSKASLFSAIWDEYQSSQEERLRRVIGTAQADGIDDGLELLLIGTRVYLEGAWSRRLVYEVVHLRDAPAGFMESSPLVTERWTRKNRRLIEADDPLLGRAMLAAVMGALGGLCREIVRCSSDAEAREVIERSVPLLGGLVQGFRQLDTGEALAAVAAR
jgi:AcrR family transcriptional regulator